MGDYDAPRDARDVAGDLWTALRTHDRAALAREMHAESVLYVDLPQAIVPFGGITSGRDSVLQRFGLQWDQFATQRLNPTIRNILNNVVYADVEFAYQCRSTGHVLEGRLDHIIEVKDDQVVGLDVMFYDFNGIAAFMRMIRGE